MTSFHLNSSIPVVNMFDDAASKAFYVNYLGYEVDWAHQFNDNVESPFYMQIRQGDSILHLNGHADKDASPCEVRIPVTGLQEFCDHLCSKESDFPKPDVVDPRGEGRNTDMSVVDPSGNQLIFWSPGINDKA